MRAVCGGRATSDFTDNGDGTITDNASGLMWAKETADIDDDSDLDTDDQATWQAALAYCEGSDLAGHSDWRLPTRKELRSIVDYSTYNPAIDINYFPDTMSSEYWSSTTFYDTKGNAWLVGFSYGYDIPDYAKSFAYYVRAVRGGQ